MVNIPSKQRTGDRIAINGDYQHHAFYHAGTLQRFWHRFKIAAAMQNLCPSPGAAILDAGCGSGMLAALLARDNPSIRVTGVDNNDQAISFCRGQWKDLPNIRFIQSQIDDLGQLKDESFDGIAFLEVIEHIAEQQAQNVLAEFYRLLKPNGKLVISTPNRQSCWPMLEWIMDTLRLAPQMRAAQHEHLYSGSELAAQAQNAGLLTLHKQRIHFIAPWIAIFSDRLAARTHAWELRQRWTPGALLLYTFTKPGPAGTSHKLCYPK
jgi:2-polyprenyl-3-methyl-5-hydroxy-6-metoxy-1,4-benzoquinol methylase